jgi:hypothetical protein
VTALSPFTVIFEELRLFSGIFLRHKIGSSGFSLQLQKLASGGLIFLMARMQLKIFEYIRETGWKSSPETGRNGGMQLNCAVAYQKLRKFPGDLP